MPSLPDEHPTPADSDQAACVHRWRINSPDADETARGTCGHCGATRVFTAATPRASPWIRTAAEKGRRQSNRPS